MAENSGSSGIASYSIRGHMVVFHEDSHEYYVDGVKVPSVTELVRKYSELHGLDDYTTVPSGSPRKAAPKGTTIQQEIGRYEKDGAEGSSEEFRNYLELKGKCGIKAESSGLPVLIFDGSGKPVCAGRLDLCGTVMGGSAIIGIRRTAKIYKGKVSLQLNLYRLGYKESYGDPCDSLYVIRLRHGASEFARIPIDENSAISVLEECLPSFSAGPAAEADAKTDKDTAADAGAEAPADKRAGAAPEKDAPKSEERREKTAERIKREAECAGNAERLRDVSWFWRFFPALAAHLLLLMLLSGTVIGWEAALHLVLTFTAACLLVWPVLAATPVTKAAGNPLVLGAAALVLKAIAYACGIFLSGIGDFVSGTGAFVAIAGLVFAAAARGTSATGNDRTGLYLSGIAYVLCTITEVSCLGSIAGA